MLTCNECETVADEAAAGWQAHLAYDPREDEESFVVFFLPGLRRARVRRRREHVTNARPEDLAARLLGVWRLRSYDDRASTEAEWTQTYGPEVDGLIIYDRSGWVSVHALGRGRFDSYFGHFDVAEVRDNNGGVQGVAHHRVVACSMPELLTADTARPFRVLGDTLILGDERTWRRICERVG